jgi:hypothetical protein
VVFGPENEIEIYGYPKEVFPPTDFHTATLVGDEIIVIGCLGNVKDRRLGFTPVYSVNTKSFRISEMITSGMGPGWIFEHAAELSADSLTSIRGGQRVELKNGKQRFQRNNEEFSLHIRTGSWTQVTNRNWPQWTIGQEDDGVFVLDQGVRLRDLVPAGLDRIFASDERDREARFLLRGVPIRVMAGVRWIEIVAEGDLSEQLCREVPEAFRRSVESLCKRKCVVE